MVSIEEIQAAYYMVAATGVLVAAAYYVYNMRTNQKATRTTLETRQAQLFMPIYSTFYSDEFLKAFYAIMSLTYDNYDDYVAKYSYTANPEVGRSHAKVNMYLEGIGVLVKRGLIEPSLVDDLMSSIVVSYWEKYGPYILEVRVRRNHPQNGEYVEYLYGQIKPIVERQHGVHAEGLKVVH
jgi:hypothetical protein